MEAPPVRGPKHEALAVFLGNWRAEGTSFGGSDQTGENASAGGAPWMSTHVSRWHTGEFFLIQDEKATLTATVFDTLSIMGVDENTGGYFARTFENHGFYRHYQVTVNGKTWQLIGDTERARIVFSDNDRTQVITWEWKPDTEWLPLCDRTAVRIN